MNILRIYFKTKTYLALALALAPDPTPLFSTESISYIFNSIGPGFVDGEHAGDY